MNTNDETLYTGQNMNGSNQQAEYTTITAGTETPEVQQAPKAGKRWVKVAVGAAGGILLGAGAVGAAHLISDHLANADEEAVAPETETADAETADADTTAEPAADADTQAVAPVANVQPGLSFDQAFAQARAELGPGGVFHWRGGIYGTYYADEWNAMSEAERHDFAMSVRPEYGVDRINTHTITPENPQVNITADNGEHLETANEDEDLVALHNETRIEEGPVDQTYNDDLAINRTEQHEDDSDVHIVGTESVDLDDGTTATIDHLVVDGHEAMVVDLDGDGTPELATFDMNGNSQIDNGEIMDLATGDVLNTDGTLYGAAPTGMPYEDADPTAASSTEAEVDTFNI